MRESPERYAATLLSGHVQRRRSLSLLYIIFQMWNHCLFYNFINENDIKVKTISMPAVNHGDCAAQNLRRADMSACPAYAT